MGKAVILLYHRIAQAESDPQQLCVTPTHFEEHLEHIRKNYRVMSLRRLRRWLRIGWLPGNSVVITFDDGYADNLWNAKPLLEKWDVPATVFVVSGYIGKKHEFWWDDLERILLVPASLPAELSLSIQGASHTWPTQTLQNRRDVYDELHRLLRPLDAASRRALLNQLADWAGVGKTARSTHRILDENEIHRLVGNGLIEVGAHTVTHPVLAVQSSASQRREILDCKRYLEEIIGRSVTSFSYPFGTRDDIGQETPLLVDEAGFTLACANIPGIVKRHSNPFKLSRYLVRDWDGERFGVMLRHFFALP